MTVRNSNKQDKQTRQGNFLEKLPSRERLDLSERGHWKMMASAVQIIPVVIVAVFSVLIQLFVVWKCEKRELDQDLKN